MTLFIVITRDNLTLDLTITSFPDDVTVSEFNLLNREPQAITALSS